MSQDDGIYVKGASEHNLKDIDIYIPRNQLTVITGLSGSGKSSVAFDVIYAEGQRRYIESLSAYARNFMEQLKKPDVKFISGLSPSIAINQKTITTNPRSTVGTVTEIYDYMRLLFARVGIPHCPTHKIPVTQQTVEHIVESVMSLPKGAQFYVVAPMVQDQKGEFLAEFNKWIKKGFTRVKIDNQWLDLDKAQKLSKHKKHSIYLLVDRLIVDDKFRERLFNSIDLALKTASGLIGIEVVKLPKTTQKNKKSSQKNNLLGNNQDGESIHIYSINRACPHCGYSYPEMESRLFSFNNPKGACSTCNGLSIVVSDEEYFDESKSLQEIDGEECIDEQICPDCEGTGLRERARNVFVGGKNIAELSDLSTEDLLAFFPQIKFSPRDKIIASKILKQIVGRLTYMLRVGTDYLSLNRRTNTLSGGEVQRIRLATQLGSALIGVLYVLDEPSIGLHPKDHQQLLGVIQEIKDRGNTLIVVEHDEDTIKTADHIIDMGPGAGILGGEVVGTGGLSDIKKSKRSLTGKYLSGVKKIPVPAQRRKGQGNNLILKGARGNNLKNVDFTVPLGTLCGITGVSGSGKSTLVIDTLYKALATELLRAEYFSEKYDSLEGLEFIDRVIQINQKPIGRTPRSVPATYVGVLPLVRELFSHLPESKLRGYRPGQFSFNVKGGRCEFCEGAGTKKVSMHFLSDVSVVCDSCGGSRYNPEILNIRFKQKNISDILNMSVKEAHEFFKNHKFIERKLNTLLKVGMDYMSLGQKSTTLSGGEAQRVKLSRELCKRNTGKTLYILDEPTTGLHFEDVKKLVELLHELVDQGSTIIVIEHNMDVIKSCDYVVDLGPGGGRHGGQIIGQGTPEEISKIKKSHTGSFLAPYL